MRKVLSIVRKFVIVVLLLLTVVTGLVWVISFFVPARNNSRLWLRTDNAILLSQGRSWQVISGLAADDNKLSFWTSDGAFQVTYLRLVVSLSTDERDREWAIGPVEFFRVRFPRPRPPDRRDLISDFLGLEQIQPLYWLSEQSTLRVPFWIPFTALALYPTLAFIRGPLRRWRRRKKGHCPQCGYNLTGNVSGVCPECGIKLQESITHDDNNGEAYNEQ